jgi:hypothetical protein
VNEIIKLLLLAPGAPVPIVAWVALLFFCVLTLHATIRMLRAALALRNEWKMRPR